MAVFESEPNSFFCQKLVSNSEVHPPQKKWQKSYVVSELEIARRPKIEFGINPKSESGALHLNGAVKVNFEFDGVSSSSVSFGVG